jgi:putative transposase
VDFQFDVTTDGRPIKIVSIVDEHTRESWAGWCGHGHSA